MSYHGFEKALRRAVATLLSAATMASVWLAPVLPARAAGVPPVFVSASSAYGTEQDNVATDLSDSLTIAAPSSISAGNLLIAGIANNDHASNILLSPPEGWVPLVTAEDGTGNQKGGIQVFYKIASGSEPADYTWTWTAYDEVARQSRLAGGIMNYFSPDGVQIDAVAVTSALAVSTIGTPTVTTTETDDVIVNFYSIDDNGSFDTYSTGDERFDVTNPYLSGGANDGPTISGADYVQALADVSVSQSSVHTGSNTSTMFAVTVALMAGTDAFAPVISEVTPVSTPVVEDSATYVFTSDESGTLSIGGACSSTTTVAYEGTNTITFDGLSPGAYDDCSITVTDAFGNVSNAVDVTDFSVDHSAPVYLSASATPNDGAGDTSITVPAPGSMFEGNLLLAAVNYTGGTGTVVTPPADWVLIRTVNNTTVTGMKTYYKVITDSEPSDYVWSFGGTVGASAIILQYSGVDPVSPIDAEAGNTQGSGAANVQSSQVTTTYQAERVVIFYGKDTNLSLAADPLTVQLASAMHVTSPSLMAAQFVQAAAGLTPAGLTATGTGNAVRHAQTVALRTYFDVTGPTLAVDTAVATPDNDSTPEFKFTSDEAGTATFGGACSGTSSVGVTVGINTVSFDTLADGTHTDCTVTVTDGASNASAPLAVASFTIDATNPTATITDQPADPSGVATADFTFTTDDGSGTGVTNVDCDLDAGGFAACDSTTEHTLSGLSDGSHTLTVRATDAVGNEGTDDYTWLVDLTDPTVTIDSDPGDPSSSSSASFTFTGDDGSGSGISLTECKLDAGSFAACDSSSAHALSGLGEGAHTFTVRVTDGVGRTATDDYTWTVDTIDPTVSITSGPSGLTTTASASFTFTTGDVDGTGVTDVDCDLDAGGYAACDSTTEHALTGLVEGAHTLTVRATDAAGNTATDEREWTVDLTDPNTTFDTTPDSPSSGSVSFTWTATETSVFRCKMDDGAFTVCESGDVFSGLSSGSHTFSVETTDTAGNMDDTHATHTWTVDATAPDTFMESMPDAFDNDTTGDFTFAANEDATFECKVDDDAFAVCTSPFATDVLGDGSHTFEVRAIDTVGNVDASPATFTWTVDTEAPTLAEVTPVPTPRSDKTPSYTFSSSEAGTIYYDGDCSSATDEATSGDNTVTFNSLSLGVHDNCEVSVEDAAGNSSSWLSVTSFRVTSSGGGVPASVTVVLPNGGETFTYGDTTNIVWVYGGSNVTGVRLSYSKNGGISWSSISPSEGGNSIQWTAPNVGTIHGRIRAELMDGSTVLATDISDADFTIVSSTGSTEMMESDSLTGDYVPAKAMQEAWSINVDNGISDADAPEAPLCVSGSLIKLPSDNDSSTQIDSTVYFCGQDGKRYVFPSTGVFKSWYSDYSGVVEVSQETMAALVLGGNVRYRPGKRMIKLQTDEKTYAIAPGGVLRWVTTEAAAVRLYGSDWNSKIDDVSDAFFVDYVVGEPINE